MTLSGLLVKNTKFAMTNSNVLKSYCILFYTHKLPFNIQIFVKLFCCFAVLFLTSQKNFAQPDTSLERRWAGILNQYKSGNLNDTAYLDEAQVLVDLSIKDVTLKEKLSLYQKIAWSNPAFQKRRLRYYLMLYNNTLYTYRAGASIYYMEKAEEERKKIKPYTNTLLGSVAILFNYGRTKSGHARCFEEYERILPFLKELPQRITTDSVPVNTIQNAMAILVDIADFYSQRKDTTNAMKAIVLSENIRNSIKEKGQYTDAVLHRPYYSYYLAQHTKKKLEKQPGLAKVMLDSAYAVVNDNHTTEKYIWWNAATSDMFLNYFRFFIDQKQTDSAAHYLQLIKVRQDSGMAELGDGTAYLYNYGLLKANEGDYKTAYEKILNAYEINDSVIGVKTADINNNMYAQTLAEDKTEALQKSEAQKSKRNMLIAVISAISLVSIIFLYIWMRKKEKEAKDRIYKLSYASRLQIMELEEKSLLIKKEEQKRLGMDLHDDLVGTIAATKIKVETELINNHDAGQVERLKTISKLLTHMYESARDKSHQLYHGQGNEPEVPFSKRINLLTENSFTSSKYKTTIEVDDGLMKEVSLPIKIQLLYIIQEAITNIIKHSYATNISILIYEDISGLVLHISDDGKGFNTEVKKKGIGLNSIHERAATVKGNVEIMSGNKGTEITLTIPL